MPTLYFAAVVSSSSFFFPRLFSAVAIGCVPYFHTWCGLSANLECRSELCCTRLTETQDAKNCQKFAICAPSHKFVRLSSQLRHVSTLGRKNLLNINNSSTCPHNMVNFSPLTAEIGSLVCGTPPNFNRFRVLESLLHLCRSLEANQSCTMFGHLLGCYSIYISGGSCPLMKFYQVQNSLWVQVLCSPILAALLHSTPAAGISQTLRHGTRNGITELSQRVPPTFGWEAITLSIGPHYSYKFTDQSASKIFYKSSAVAEMGDRLATIDMGRKVGSSMPLSMWKLSPHLAQYDLGWGLSPYQVTSWSIQLFGHNRHGPKIGGLCPFFRAGEQRYRREWSPSKFEVEGMEMVISPSIISQTSG